MFNGFKICFFICLFGFLFSALHNPLQAQAYQAFPTDSATWKVTRCWFLFPAGWYDSYSLSIDGSDTLYAGQSFKKIFMSERQIHGSFDSLYPTRFFGGMREENKQVFMFQTWASIDTTVHLIYDFNHTDVGDTIFTSSLPGPSSSLYGHLITSVDSVLIGTAYHQRLHLEDINNPYNTEFWIEGVGSSWGLPFATHWTITDNSYDLNCFYKQKLLNYENPVPTYNFCYAPPPMITCDSVLTTVNWQTNTEANGIHLLPNPAKDNFTILFDTAPIQQTQYYIYNAPGQLVKQNHITENTTIVDAKGLKNGIYFIIIKWKQTSISKKLIIQNAY